MHNTAIHVHTMRSLVIAAVCSPELLVLKRVKLL